VTLTHTKKESGAKRSVKEAKRSERLKREREAKHWSNAEAQAGAIAKCEAFVEREHYFQFSKVLIDNINQFIEK
jgi:hypothetical protein